MQVKWHVECFSERVEVDVVEAEEVVHVEGACGRHDCNGRRISSSRRSRVSEAPIVYGLRRVRERIGRRDEAKD